MTEVMRLILKDRMECKLAGQCPMHVPSVVQSRQNCVDGVSDDTYTCEKIDLLSFVSLADLGSSSSASGNDIWGWFDSTTNRYYALTGQSDGASVVDITDPENPDVLGTYYTNYTYI